MLARQLKPGNQTRGTRLGRGGQAGRYARGTSAAASSYTHIPPSTTALQRNRAQPKPWGVRQLLRPPEETTTLGRQLIFFFFFLAADVFIGAISQSSGNRSGPASYPFLNLFWGNGEEGQPSPGIPSALY